MLKNTINKFFFKKKKKKNSKQQKKFHCYQKDVPLSSSIEDNQDDNQDDSQNEELRSVRRFIQNYRKEVLNSDKKYREFYENNYSDLNGNTEASLNSLERNLKEYKMYINNFQLKHCQLDKTQKTDDKQADKENNKEPNKSKSSYIGKLFNLKNNKKSNQDKLRSYLNDSEPHLNAHLNSHTHVNQQLIRDIDELKSRRKLNQRLELENYYKQNFCKCQNRNVLQPMHQTELNAHYSHHDAKFSDVANKTLSKKSRKNPSRSEKLRECALEINSLGSLFTNHENDKQSQPKYKLNDHLQNSLNNKSQLIKSESYESYNPNGFGETKITPRDNENSSEFLDSSIDLSYMDNSAKSLSYSSSTTIQQEDDDQYLDTYTIESANTEDNPISTENYTKLIKKLTHSDAMRQRLLEICNQNDALDFEQEFCMKKYPTVLNLDSGTFAVTFVALDQDTKNLVVLKVIRTISKDIQNKLNQLTYSGTETFDEVYSEVMISKALSSLHHSKVNRAHCYPKILFTKLVYGQIPENFNITRLKDSKPDQIQGLTIEQFYETLNTNYDLGRSKSSILSERKKFLKQEPFKLFPDAPIEYTVIAMKYVGKPIWKRLLNRQLTAQQLFGVAQQLIFGLACAEQQFNFEHRDLHISNILIKRTKKSDVDYVINNQVYKLSTYGYRCFIVDMTFSRLTINNQIFFKDLSAVLHKRNDEHGKKLKMQDMVYQLMRDELGDDWQKFRPRTNIHWLIYVLKTIKGCDVFKQNNELIGQLLVDYSNHASQCYSLNDLIIYIVGRCS